jgi:hypothetical protein
LKSLRNSLLLAYSIPAGETRSYIENPVPLVLPVVVAVVVVALAVVVLVVVIVVVRVVVAVVTPSSNPLLLYLPNLALFLVDIFSLIKTLPPTLVNRPLLETLQVIIEHLDDLQAIILHRNLSIPRKVEIIMGKHLEAPFSPAQVMIELQ